MTSAALSSAPIPSQPPTATGTAGSARPAPSARGSRSTRTSAAPGFFTSVRVEILKMRRLRVLLVTVLLLVASIAISTMALFSLARRGTLDTPSSQP